MGVQEVSIRELRGELAKYLDMARAGEPILVRDRRAERIPVLLVRWDGAGLESARELAPSTGQEKQETREDASNPP